MKIPARVKGHLRIYLGYATGCGKSFTLLRDAVSYHQRGKKIAVAVLHHDSRPGIKEMSKILPRVDGEDLSSLSELDYDTIVIDEIGAESRLEAIIDLLKKGKNVWTTLNVQHLDSVAERVQSALQLKIRDRVPDALLNLAESVIFVDSSIDDLRARFEEGQIFDKEKAEQALIHFFNYENLSLLRKIALEEVVECQLKKIESEKILSASAQSEADPSVLVVITDEEKHFDLFNRMIHKGAKLASQQCCNFQVGLVKKKSLLKKSAKANHWLAPIKGLAEQLGGSFVELQGKNMINDIVRFATDHHIQHVVFAKPHLNQIMTPVSKAVRGVHLHLIDDRSNQKNFV